MEGIEQMTDPFTPKELAQEMLIWLERDIPETVIRTLRIVLNRYVDTGVYNDDMTTLLGYQPDHLLTTHRFAHELEAANSRAESMKRRCAEEAERVYDHGPRNMKNAILAIK